mgnify:CR=1 FL=1
MVAVSAGAHWADAAAGVEVGVDDQRQPEHNQHQQEQGRDQMQALIDEVRSGESDPAVAARSQALGAELRALVRDEIELAVFVHISDCRADAARAQPREQREAAAEDQLRECDIDPGSRQHLSE